MILDVSDAEEHIDSTKIAPTDVKDLAAWKKIDSRATCAQLPENSYKDHVELRVLAKEMASLELPTVNQWKTIEKYGKTKYKLRGWSFVEDLED